MPPVAAHKAQGMYLQITWNHLRSGFFNQNLVHMMGHGIKAGKIRFPDMKIPCVDPRDMGTMAAFIACSDYAKEHANYCYEVSGPENLVSSVDSFLKCLPSCCSRLQPR